MKQGFTLVELLVAIAIFSIVVVIGVGGFVHVLHTQREVASLISVQSNASTALEQMAREIRTGYLFCDVATNDNPTDPQANPACEPSGNTGCTFNVAGGDSTWTCNNVLDFFNGNGQEVDYGIIDGGLGRSTSGTTNYVPITGNTVRVTYLTFTIFGNTEGDHWPARVTIALGVVPSSTDPVLANDVVQLQTTVSAREIDCTAAGAC